jgi:hypothetical protein
MKTFENNWITHKKTLFTQQVITNERFILSSIADFFTPHSHPQIDNMTFGTSKFTKSSLSLLLLLTSIIGASSQVSFQNSIPKPSINYFHLISIPQSEPSINYFHSISIPINQQISIYDDTIYQLPPFLHLVSYYLNRQSHVLLKICSVQQSKWSHLNPVGKLSFSKAEAFTKIRLMVLIVRILNLQHPVVLSTPLNHPITWRYMIFFQPLGTMASWLYSRTQPSQLIRLKPEWPKSSQGAQFSDHTDSRSLSRLVLHSLRLLYPQRLQAPHQVVHLAMNHHQFLQCLPQVHAPFPSLPVDPFYYHYLMYVSRWRFSTVVVST